MMKYKYVLEFEPCDIEYVHNEINQLNIIGWLEDKHNVTLIPSEKGFTLVSKYQLNIGVRDYVSLRFSYNDDWDIIAELNRLTLTIEK